MKALKLFFNENPSVLLGFSGGVDSSYLLYAGNKYGANIKAYYVKTAFQPDFEFEDACHFAELIGVKINVLEMNILENLKVVSNPSDRCYYCKSEIFGTLCQKACEHGIPLVIDGTNASDDAGDRPGMKALDELSVRSPLRECGITKDQVRSLSKEANLPTWDKPAYACLATRIPVERRITSDLLQRVEKSEDALFLLGFTNFRVRIIGEAAKLQFPSNLIDEAISRKEEIIKLIKPFFSSILLDMEGR